MTTTTTVTRRRPAPPTPTADAPSLDARAAALTRLGMRIFAGAPLTDVDVYGAALAHPALTPDQVRGLIHQVGVGGTSGQTTLARRALFTLLHGGPDSVACGPCLMDRKRPAHLIAPAGNCAEHSMGGAK